MKIFTESPGNLMYPGSEIKREKTFKREREMEREAKR